MASSTLVKSLWDLREGDHIKWKRLAGYDHHAIVERVDHTRKKVHVIEYASDDGGSSFGKGVITRNVYGVSGMYKYLYDCCYDAYRVLQRAISRLGERNYKPLANNCEHFATWCKIGEKYCSQIRPFVTRVGLSAANAATATAKALVSGVKGIGAKALRAAGSVWSVVMEGCLFGYNCYKAVKNYKAAIKHADVDDYGMVQNCKWQRNKNIGEAACESGGAVAGSAVGAALGSFIPVVGTVVGTVIGAVVGGIGGRWLGRMFGRILSLFF